MGFRVIEIQKRKKNLLESFFFTFLSHCYRFMSYFEINVVFSNIIPIGVSTCKTLVLGLAISEI